MLNTLDAIVERLVTGLVGRRRRTRAGPSRWADAVMRQTRALLESSPG